VATVDSVTSRPWAARAPVFPISDSPTVDGVVASMLTLLACPRLAVPWAGAATDRDSLEVKCNLR
jgi:hypothetical protein